MCPRSGGRRDRPGSHRTSPSLARLPAAAKGADALRAAIRLVRTFYLAALIMKCPGNDCVLPPRSLIATTHNM
jgi:hypothetical protein